MIDDLKRMLIAAVQFIHLLIKDIREGKFPYDAGELAFD